MSSTKKIAVGFGLYVEHMVEFSAVGEKVSLSTPPRIHIGGGAYNIARTLHALGSSSFLYGICGRSESPERAMLESLLRNESMPVQTLPLAERTSSSYYLHNTTENSTVGVGDAGGNIFLTDDTRELFEKNLCTTRVLAEVRPELLALARLFLETGDAANTVIIPSSSILTHTEGRTVVDCAGMLSCNEQEAHEYIGKRISKETLLEFPQQIVFVTRGHRSAFLKVDHEIHEATPEEISSPIYPNGAGDAATAGLIHALSTRALPPQEALVYALKIGTAVCTRPEPFFVR